MRQQLCAACQGPGKFACKSCLLVVYCNATCQKSHWSAHKSECKSAVSREDWKPGWYREWRDPSFITDGPLTWAEPRRSLLGNVPALDVLQLHANEGAHCGTDLKLLFAASGDLRNVVKTLSAVPHAYANTLSIAINDCDLDIVARNAILLLLAFTEDSAERAADCMLHVWYSAFLTQTHVDTLCRRVRPLVQDVCKQIGSKVTDNVLSETWQFTSASLRLKLAEQQWVACLAYLDVASGLTQDVAMQKRTAVTMAHEQRDERDRHLFAMPRRHRLSFLRFLTDGMVLPFGSSRLPFTFPNPTFFRSGEWPRHGWANPLAGWHYADVIDTRYGPAENDVYGKLYSHVSSLLQQLHARIRSLKTEFTLLCVDPAALSEHLDDNVFARVEISNISDDCNFGPEKAIRRLGRFLQPPSINSHATLISLFVSAVNDSVTEAEMNKDLIADGPLLEAYTPRNDLPLSSFDPLFLMRLFAQILIRDNDRYFAKYMKESDFPLIEHNTGVVMKATHTVVEKWPWRLKKRPPEAGARQEFELLLASAHTGSERYVEWKKAG